MSWLPEARCGGHQNCLATLLILQVGQWEAQHLVLFPHHPLWPGLRGQVAEGADTTGPNGEREVGCWGPGGGISLSVTAHSLSLPCIIVACGATVPGDVLRQVWSSLLSPLQSLGSGDHHPPQCADSVCWLLLTAHIWTRVSCTSNNPPYAPWA